MLTESDLRDWDNWIAEREPGAVSGVTVSRVKELVDDLKYFKSLYTDMSAILEKSRIDLKACEEYRDCVYGERNKLVCALSKVFPAALARHSEYDKDWEEDWRWIVYITIPTGQVSWHIHDSELPDFNHLSRITACWDGHSIEEKYRRLKELLPVKNKDLVDEVRSLRIHTNVLEETLDLEHQSAARLEEEIKVLHHALYLVVFNTFEPGRPEVSDWIKKAREAFK
jgi:hypothetical protein